MTAWVLTKSKLSIKEKKLNSEQVSDKIYDSKEDAIAALKIFVDTLDLKHEKKSHISDTTVYPPCACYECYGEISIPVVYGIGHFSNENKKGSSILDGKEWRVHGTFYQITTVSFAE